MDNRACVNYLIKRFPKYSIEVIKEKKSVLVIKALSNNKAYIIKCYLNRITQTYREININNFLFDIDYNCAKITDVLEYENYIFIVFEFVIGKSLAEYVYRDDFISKIRLLCKHISKLHSIENFDCLFKYQIQVETYIKEKIKKCEVILNKYKIHEYQNIILYLKRNFKKIDQTRPSILHGDLQFYNVLIKNNDNKSLCIIDFEHSFICDYRIDLARLFIGIPDDIQEIIMIYYEKYSGRKIEQLIYFLVLESFYNILVFKVVSYGSDLDNYVKMCNENFNAYIMKT